MISATGLTLLISVALAMTLLSPVILLGLLLKDWKEQRLW